MHGRKRNRMNSDCKCSDNAGIKASKCNHPKAIRAILGAVLARPVGAGLHVKLDDIAGVGEGAWPKCNSESRGPSDET